MDIVIITASILAILVWLWLTTLGVIAAKHDFTLEPFQRKAQIIIVLLVPFFGAAIVLHLANQHCPDVVPIKWFPRPLRSLILGKPRPRNRNRDNNEDSGIDLTVNHNQHSQSDIGGGGD